MAKVLYGAVGILLAAACICTGEKKLSQTDRQIYEKACSLEQEMEMLGFSGFSVRDYRVRYYDGDCDYVIAPSADTYTVTREKPKLDTFAGTIVKVGKEYQIVLPTYEKFKNFFAALDTVGSLQQQKEAGETVFALDSSVKKRRQQSSGMRHFMHGSRKTGWIRHMHWDRKTEKQSLKNMLIRIPFRKKHSQRK